MRSALIALKAARNGVEAADRIIHSERDIGMSPDAVQVWFHRLYEASVRTRAVPRRRARPAGIRRQLALAAVRWIMVPLALILQDRPWVSTVRAWSKLFIVPSDTPLRWASSSQVAPSRKADADGGWLPRFQLFQTANQAMVLLRLEADEDIPASSAAFRIRLYEWS
jgi:hypothetical protein